ncbi:MAG: hypothetical protein RIQ89_1831 [Bacteroidota bacterium]|jgi:hypothetical protein
MHLKLIKHCITLLMKKILFTLIALFTVQIAWSQAKNFRAIENKAFKPGEKLKFRIHYGFMDAGIAELQVHDEIKTFGGRSCYHFIGTGKTQGAFDWFFKVRDRYESFTDKNALMPWLFVRRVDEGGYIINQNVSFNHWSDSAKSEKKTIKIEAYTQDLVSAFYYARTLDLQHANEGDVFPIMGYLDDELMPLNIKFIGRDVVKTKFGKIKCLKFKPLLQEGRVFKESESMMVWISDDENKIPIRLQSEILVGSIKMDIADYQNLVAPLAKVN